MEQTRLYIEGEEVELTGGVQFLLNRQFEEISDPTVIINDWSKTVEIPSTQSNDTLFGHIYNPDRVIADGGVTGIYFDPYRKLGFRLEYGSDVIMTGYAKMTDIARKGGHVTYNVTLNGEMGKVFQELKKITFDCSTEDADYLIHGEDWVLAQINKELVQQAFGRGGQTSEYPSSGDVLNTIGFVPNNSFMDGFDYKTYQYSDSASTEFKTTLPADFQNATGISPDNAIGEGLTPRALGEYRSYQQLPFIFFNKLWRIFQAKAEAVTGWTFDLDNMWFRTTNPYWYSVVLMLKNLGTREVAADTNNIYKQYALEVNSDIKEYEEWSNSGTSDWRYHTGTQRFRAIVVSESVPMVTQQRPGYYDVSVFHLDYAHMISIPGFCSIGKYESGGHSSQAAVAMKNTAALYVSARIWVGAGEYVTIPWAAIVPESYSGAVTEGYKVIKVADNGSALAYRFYGWNVALPSIQLSAMTVGAEGDYNIQIMTSWSCDGLPVTATGSQFDDTFRFYFSYYNETGAGMTRTDRTSVVSYNVASQSSFTLNDLWNNDHTPFDFILRYCKMMRLSILADANTKTLRFTPTERWMAEASGVTLDWTDKVDYSRDGGIKPISFDTQYINLGYAEGQTAIGKAYAEKYGVNYGDMKLRTLYQFNNDTTELFDGLVPPLTATLQTLSWNTLTAKRVAYTVVPEEFVDVMDADGKFCDPFGMMLLHCGLQAFQGGDMRIPKITDDTNLQRASGKRFYSQAVAGSYVDVAQYPRLSSRLNSQYLTFGIPKESFVYGDNPPAQCTSLYSGRWQKYMAERYNRNNKVVTLYVRLKPYEFASFSHNQLVTICNQLYFVNRITDYDMTTDASVLVELITVQQRSQYY